MTTGAPRTRSRSAPTRRARRTQERGDRTRQAVIDETVRCIREEGFAAASASHIAERAGVTWGVIQYHFGDRDTLLMAVVDHGNAILGDAIAGLEVPDGSVRDQAELIVDAAWRAFSQPASMAALEILVATRSDRGPTTTEHLVELADQLARLGRDLTDKTRVGHRRAIGALLWATLRGLVLAQMVVHEPVDTSDARAALVEVLTAYLETGEGRRG